jgi:tetratricopeptide (TPR) repeat protein
MKLIMLAYDKLEDGTTARTIADKLKFDKISEPEKLKLARDFLKKDPELGEKIYSQLEDVAAGKMELFKHYLAEGNTTKAIALAGELRKLDKYAEEMSFQYPKLLIADKQYAEATKALKLLKNSVEIQWQIAECCILMNDIDQAAAELRVIIKKYKQDALKAAIKIATLYTEADNKKEAYLAWKDVLDLTPHFSKEAQMARAALNTLPPAMPEEIPLHLSY